jgi:hypothetical protein
MTDDEIEAAWGEVFDALPAAWSVRTVASSH